MRYPSFIEKGNTIGFVAPSFGCAGEPYYSAFQNSLKKWNALGFKTELGFNCYASDGVGISSSPKKCAAEFMEYYKKETNQALISCGGGELMCEILEFIDFDNSQEADDLRAYHNCHFICRELRISAISCLRYYPTSEVLTLLRKYANDIDNDIRKCADSSLSYALKGFRQ